MNKFKKHLQLQMTASYHNNVIKQHKLTYLFWECTLGCNFFCQHCGSMAGKPLADELKTEEIISAFRSIAEDCDSREIFLAVTGGEPLMRRDLFEVMSEAHKLGFEWGMVSNGYLINEAMIEKMKAAGMGSISISLDGIAETNDRLRGVPGAFQKAIQAIKMLKESQAFQFVEVITTFNKQNIDQIDELYQLMIDLGVDGWRLGEVDMIGRVEEGNTLELDETEMKRMFSFIKEKRPLAPFRFDYRCSGFLGLEYEAEVRDNYFYCNTGINAASILANGDIYVCPDVPRIKDLIQGNIRQDRFSEVWENKFKPFRDKNRTSCQSCKKCGYWFACLGGPFHTWNFDEQRPNKCVYKMLTK